MVPLFSSTKVTFMCFTKLYIRLVCIRFLNNFTKRMKDSGIDSSSPDHVELEFLKACREAKGKDERFVSLNLL